METSSIHPPLIARSRHVLATGALALTALASSGCSSSGQAPGDVAGGSGSGGAPSTSSASTSGAGGSNAGTGGGGAGSGGANAGSGGAGAGGGGGADGGPPATCAALLGGTGAQSAWVSVDATGKLAYKKTPKGDRILDFSHAGYMGGGVAIPTLPVAAMVSPSSGDDTAAIQAAIDKVAAVPPKGGIRGAVLLAPGTFHVSGTLKITASGVVLRGSGSGQKGGAVTEVQVTGTPSGQQAFLVMQGTGSLQTTGTAAHVTDSYVPSGATTLGVDDASGLAVGDDVVVVRPVTQAWVHFMGMDTLVRNGMPQTWLSVGSTSEAQRTITAISGKQITLDVPLADSYDATYLSPPGATVSRYTFAGRISQVGFESMKLVAPPSTTDIGQPHFELLVMSGVSDGWVHDIAAQDFVGAGGTGTIAVESNCRRLTIEDVAFTHTVAQDQGAGAPIDFGIKGTQVLVQRSSVAGDSLFSMATHTLAVGPHAVLHFSATGNSNNLAPHQRWGTGLLVDNARSPSGIDFMDRGYLGSGHGWTMGFGVAWSSTAASLLIQAPPGSTNWAIGCQGTETTAAEPGGSSTILPQGIIDAQGTPVHPGSLYLAQLCERLGPAAVAAIGYP